MEEVPAAPPKRTEWGPILLLILAVGGSAVGVMLYQRSQGRSGNANDAAGFDLAQTTEANRPAAGGARTAPSSSAPGSSLGMITVGNFNRGNSAAAMTPLQATQLSLANICRANEDRVREMGERYTRAHPIFVAFGQEWMKDPQLKKLNDDYFRYHDPAAFLHGAATSKHFAQMVAKYAVNPAFQQYAREAMQTAPPQARQVALDYVDKDKIAASVVDNVMQALGLPPGILGGANATLPQFDASKMLNSVLNSNPLLQKQLNAKDSSVNDPELQKRLKNLNH